MVWWVAWCSVLGRMVCWAVWCGLVWCGLVWCAAPCGRGVAAGERDITHEEIVL